VHARARGLERHPCPLCQKPFARRFHLQRHLQERHPDHATAPPSAMHTCSACHYSTRRADNFQTHRNSAKCRARRGQVEEQAAATMTKAKAVATDRALHRRAQDLTIADAVRRTALAERLTRTKRVSRAAPRAAKQSMPLRALWVDQTAAVQPRTFGFSIESSAQ
jgi:prophage DNA circulation protein